MGRAFASLLAAAGLAGCASTPGADTRLPAAYEAPQPPAAAPAAALDRWWTAFGDPQLTALVEQALVANPDARSAAARLDEARAARAGVLTQFLPNGQLVGQGRRTRTEQLSGTVANFPGFTTSGVSETYSADFSVSWEVDLFGRLFAANRAARGDVAAARFAYEGARASLAAQVADAYFQARGLAIQLADAEETARIQQSLHDVAVRRAERGLAATSEPDRVAGDLAQARAQTAALRAELQVERRTLLVLAGRIVESTEGVDTPPQVGAAPLVPAALPGELLARRPDVREAQARVQSAAGRRDVARLAFLPTLTFTPGIGWSKVVQPGFSSTTQHWSVGGNLSQPVLNIPTLLANLKAENARTRQAVIAYEKAVQTAFSDAEAALVRLDADRRQVALLTDGEARARRAYEAARIGYGRGLTDLTTTLGAERAWRAVHAQLSSAQVQALRRTIQAYKALGGGWPAEAFPSNAKAG